MEEFKITKRRLPHWSREGAAYFISFRLKQGKLSSEEIKLVLDHLQAGDPEFYELLAAVVMPDHVHFLALPNPGVELSRMMKGIKGVTARKINQARGSRGSLWQDESFDRILRDQEEFEEKLEYIFTNPVKAGLVEEGWNYPGFYFKGDRQECLSYRPDIRD